MTLAQTIAHVLQTRNFGGLLAATWGCMLGGSLLLVSLTTVVGVLRGSPYTALLLQVLYGGLVLGIYYHLAQQVYRSKGVRGIKPAVTMFGRTLAISALLPLTIVLALYDAWHETRSTKSASEHQRELHPSLTAQIGRYYGRMAHVA